MLRIERIAEHVAALGEVVFTAPVSLRLAVVAALAHRRESIEWRKWITALIDRLAVVNDGRNLDAANLQARFTQRVDLQFLPSQPLPALCAVRPCRHVSPDQGCRIEHHRTRRDSDCHR